jgi:integrase
MPVYQRNKIWWFRMKWKGTLIRESSGLTGAEGKEFAKRKEAERRTALAHDEQGYKQKQKPMKFKAAAEAFIESQIDWAVKTRTLHNTSLNHLDEYFGDCFLDEITPEKIVQYQRARLKEKATGRKTTTSKRTVNIEVSLIRLVLTKHKRWGRISDDVKFYKETKDTGRALKLDEKNRLLAAAQSSISYSLYPAVLLSIHTGLRNEELRLLHWSTVELI